MIERHVAFEVFPDKCQDFEDFIHHKYRPAMAKMVGFINVGLLRQQELPNNYKMIIRFNSVEEAAGWRNSDAHQALQPKLKSLYRNLQLTVYDVIS